MSDVGDYVEAEHLYRTLLPAVPNADDVLHWLGDTQMAQASYRKAGKTFQELLARYPHRGILRYKLAVARLASGQRDAAIATFQSFHDIVSDDANHFLCKTRAQEILIRLMGVAGMEEQEQETQAHEDANRLTAAAQPLLTPLLPAGSSAHLHATPSIYGWKASKLKH